MAYELHSDVCRLTAMYYLFVQLFALAVSSIVLSAQTSGSAETRNEPAQRSTSGELRVPNRAPKSLFEDEQGKQRTEIHYDPASGTVTLKLLVQDRNGYFIPNIRRENFAVYEDGVRQTNATIGVEHAPATLGVLLEHGGRFPGLNKDLVAEVSRASRQLLETVGQGDRVTIWTYAESVNQLADASQSHEKLAGLLFALPTPEMSETNLYDAVIFMLNHMRQVTGRKALILISTGVDTFSRVRYEDALAAAKDGDTPIYAIGLSSALKESAELHGETNALHIDWVGAENKLLALAKASGGRLYLPYSTVDLSATYDDLLENLKVRYVIAYKSSHRSPPGVIHTIRVELVNPDTGKALQIVDASGKPIRAKVVVNESYTVSRVPGAATQ